MRLDLFLKASGLVKRRTVAQELCEEDRVLVNGREARPAKDVKQGDRLTLRFSARSVTLEVLRIPVSARKTGADALYRVLEDKRNDAPGGAWENFRT